MKLKNIILGLGLSLLMNTTFAQGGLEGIVVERYYQTNAADGTNASTNSAINALATGTVVYRVYVDMAAGYKFSQLYGSSTHDFKLNTTTNFYNDPNYGSTTNPAAISLINARKNTALIDSWFTAGGVCAGKSGVLKTEDTDGSIGNTQSILANNPGSCYGAPINGTNAQDGLVASTSLTAVNPNVLGITSTQLNLLDQGTGNSFLTNNGSIAALGGVRGTNASNMVLVGQFTTNGVLSFELNVQIIAANGTAENWVARNRTGNEYTSPSLIFSSTPIAGTVTASAISICTGSSSLLTLTGNSGDIQWQVSTTSSSTGFTDIAGATSNTYNATSLTANCWYRAKVSKSSCAIVYTTARSIAVTTVPSVGGTASSNNVNLCTGNGTTINLAGSSGTIVWQMSSNWTAATPTWSTVSGQTTTTLTTGNMTSSRAYRAKLTSGNCISYSNEIVVNVSPNSTVGAILGGGSQCINSTVTLSLSSATGSVQWQEGTSATGTFTNIPGATNSTFIIPTLTATRYFKAVVTSGPCSSVTSAVGTVTCVAASVGGTITFSGGSSVCLGSSKTMILSGSVGTRQWEVSTDGVNYTSISGAVNATVSVTPTVSSYYRVKVTNSVCSSVYTNPVYLTVSPLSVAGTVSSDVTICRSTGTTLTLSGNVGTIVWQRSTNWTATTPTWTTVTGQTTSTLSTGTLIASTAYRAISTSSPCSSSTSNQVVVTVSPTTTIGTVSGGGSKCFNSNVILTLSSFTGTIQWQEGTSATGTFTDIVGATSQTFEIPALTSTRFFRVRVTSGACSTLTSAVTTVTCVAASVAGNITVSGGTSICSGSGASKTLVVSGSVGTRQWESSTDGVNYTSIAGAVNATLIVTPTVSTYYRVRVVNSVCSTVYTTPVYITISEPAVGGNIGSDVNACGTTGTTLNLEGSNGSIVWQVSYSWTAATPSWSTVAGQTSSTFVTGPLSSTRAFRAMLTSGACVSYSNQVIVTRDPSLITKSITSTTTSGTTELTALCTNDLTKVLNLGSGSAGNIQWQVSTDNGVTYTDIVGATTASYTVDGPVAGKNMFRVKLSNACGVVYSSNVFSVWYQTCGARSITNTVETAFGAIAYPNPFADNFMLEVSASADEMIQVNVYDMLGKLVENHQVSVSDLSTFVIGNRFVSGVYNIEVIQGTQIERLRVVKN